MLSWLRGKQADVTPGDATLIEKILASPEMATLRRQEVQQVAERRRGLLAERAANEAQQMSLTRGYAPKEAAANERIEAAHQAVAAAIEARQQVAVAKHAALWPLEHRVSRIDIELAGTAPDEAIAAACERLQALFESTNQAADSIKANTMDGYGRVVWDNRASFLARNEAISKALRSIRDMAATALTPDEVMSACDALIEALPAVEGRPAGWETKWWG